MIRIVITQYTAHEMVIIVTVRLLDTTRDIVIIVVTTCARDLRRRDVYRIANSGA